MNEKSIVNEAIAENPATIAETIPTAEPTATENEEVEDAVDYAEILKNDLTELKEEFPELGENFDIPDLKDPLRFGALRDLGLSAKEAYLATGGARKVYDNRAHLTVSVPRNAVTPKQSIPRAELNIVRDVLGDISDEELERLYRKVNS